MLITLGPHSTIGPDHESCRMTTTRSTTEKPTGKEERYLSRAVVMEIPAKSRNTIKNRLLQMGFYPGIVA